MTLDQLRADWLARDQHLQEHLHHRVQLNTQALRRLLVQGPRRAALGQAWLGLVLQAALGAAGLGLLGWQVSAGGLSLPLQGCALLLALWMLAAVASALHHFAALRGLDFDAPLLQRRQRFEQQRLRRLQHLRLALITGTVVWCVPLAALLLHAATGIDLFHAAPSATLVAQLATLAVALSADRLARHRAARGAWPRRLAPWLDALAGQEIVAVRRLLAELEAFERGEI